MVNEINNNLLKYYIETWGCQMNEEDSEKLSGMLKRLGYTRTEDKNEAGIILYNTCCVRENAENKVFGNLGQLKKLKEKNPDLIIGICGCMMQQEGMADKILKQFPYVNIIFGTHNAYKFPEYLNRVRTEGVQIKEIFNKEEEIVEGLPIDRQSDVKAFVTIMYGCNNFCTYCIVPFVRGRERSRKPEDIINEIDGLERVRFMTSHPKDLNEDVIKAIKECGKLCEQIHLPVQSGSDRILKKMNRHYTREYYMSLINKIKQEIPDVAITTDIIVGFPGETEEDFLDTLNLVKEVQYDSAFTFIYSRRNNTPADMMLNQVSEEDKHHRFNRLVEAVNNGVIAKNKAYDGKVVEVLVEGTSKNDESKLSGRTRNGRLVNFSGEGVKVGDLVNVKITKAQNFSLMGEAIK